MEEFYFAIPTDTKQNEEYLVLEIRVYRKSVHGGQMFPLASLFLITECYVVNAL